MRGCADMLVGRAFDIFWEGGRTLLGKAEEHKLHLCGYTLRFRQRFITGGLMVPLFIMPPSQSDPETARLRHMLDIHQFHLKKV